MLPCVPFQALSDVQSTFGEPGIEHTQFSVCLISISAGHLSRRAGLARHPSGGHLIVTTVLFTAPASPADKARNSSSSQGFISETSALKRTESNRFPVSTDGCDSECKTRIEGEAHRPPRSASQIGAAFRLPCSEFSQIRIGRPVGKHPCLLDSEVLPDY